MRNFPPTWLLPTSLDLVRLPSGRSSSDGPWKFSWVKERVFRMTLPIERGKVIEELRNSRPTTKGSRCVICDRLTFDHKPYCVDHIMEMPYLNRGPR
jgi:hypothetical protein